jgi:FMN-dependent NADH-azoreductase
MTNILYISSSATGENSFSLPLGKAIVEKLQLANPDNKLVEHNLLRNPLPHITETHLTAFATPAGQRSPELQEAALLSDKAIAELMKADIVVIGAPLYNFGIPSALKAWVDHIARVDLTFRYTEQGPEGLVKGKKVYLAIATGGVYSEGPMQAYDFVTPYLKAVLGFMGMTDITVFRAEGTAIPGLKEKALKKAIAAIRL